MISIRPMKPEDVRNISLQAEQLDMRQIADNPGYGEALVAGGVSLSAVIDGRVVACFGVVEHNRYRAEAWALLAGDVAPYLKAITRAINGWLMQTGYERIEANVAVDFEPGHKWVRLLGFSPEGYEKRYFFQDGRSAKGYVRFRDGSSNTIHSLHCGGCICGRLDRAG